MTRTVLTLRTVGVGLAAGLAQLLVHVAVLAVVVRQRLLADLISALAGSVHVAGVWVEGGGGGAGDTLLLLAHLRVQAVLVGAALGLAAGLLCQALAAHHLRAVVTGAALGVPALPRLAAAAHRGRAVPVLAALRGRGGRVLCCSIKCGGRGGGRGRVGGCGWGLGGPVVPALETVRPTADRTLRVLVPAVKGEPLLQLVAAVRDTLRDPAAVRALEQAGALGAALPELPTVVLMEMEVGCAVVEKPAAVRDEAAVVQGAVGVVRVLGPLRQPPLLPAVEARHRRAEGGGRQQG